MGNTTEYKQSPIYELKDWLSDTSHVKLPAIQRGFVWKVSQIERLWDSIFRGYPIGSMMLSGVGDEMTLLDGQQRATSIALGFNNPWNYEKQRITIGNVNNLPVVWIDVIPRKNTETHLFVFRVVTRSHPWGYQLQNDTMTLPFSQRKAANNMFEKLYGEKEYTKLLPSQRLPYDATCPIPLCFLLEAVSCGKTAKWIVDRCELNIPRGYRTTGMKDEEDYYSLLESVDLSSIIKIVRERVLTTMIPSIILPKELLMDNKDTSSDESTLFVRLNSQGTRIEGEELMYSMYKAVLPESKELVESIGMNIIPPSRTITLTSRLILSEDSYIAGLSLAQFRRHVQNNEFVEKIKVLIGTKDGSLIKEKFEYAIDILKYGDVPNVVVKRFVRECPNGFLLLLHWLYKNAVKVIEDEKKKEIAARLYRNHWFGNDFDYYVRKNWNNVTASDFWSDKYFANEEWPRQYPLIQPSLLQTFLTNRLDNPIENHELMPEDEEIWQIWKAAMPKPEVLSEEDYLRRINDAWLNFLWKLLSSRDKSLILLAQKEYINSVFADFNQLDDLEDTNTPWDWDHIYPNSWVYRQWYIDDRTRKWEWRIGNFRAMSLTDNRSENNNLSPAERFDAPNENYFIHDNDLKYWRKLDASHKYIKEGDEEYVRNHALAIITRSVNIYENFLKMFDL